MTTMTSATSTRWKISALVAGIILFAVNAEAQTDVVIPSLQSKTCLDTVSLKPSKQLLVYLSGSAPDSADPGFADMGDQFTQSISQRMRKLLGGSGSALPHGEPAITWRQLMSAAVLRVTVHREGAPTFTLVDGHSPSRAGTVLLAAATEAQAAGDGTYWPSTAPGDSAEYTISIALPPLGQIFPVHATRAVFPTFSILFPPYTPATPATPASTTAPDDPFVGSTTQASAVVVADFDIDSTGHVIPSTISESWPAGKPRPTGNALETYGAFLNSVLRWLPTATFSPGRIGGCPVRQSMQLPITFGVAQ